MWMRSKQILLSTNNSDRLVLQQNTKMKQEQKHFANSRMFIEALLHPVAPFTNMV